MDEQQLLTLFIDKAIEADVVDCLMLLEDISGFTVSQCFGYSHSHSQFNIAEQVAGGRQLLKVEVLHSDKQTQSILSALKSTHSRSRIRYMLTPVSACGYITE